MARQLVFQLGDALLEAVDGALEVIDHGICYGCHCAVV